MICILNPTKKPWAKKDKLSPGSIIRRFTVHFRFIWNNFLLDKTRWNPAGNTPPASSSIPVSITIESKTGSGAIRTDSYSITDFRPFIADGEEIFNVNLESFCDCYIKRFIKFFKTNRLLQVYSVRAEKTWCRFQLCQKNLNSMLNTLPLTSWIWWA